MPQSLSKLYVHLIFSTKHREPLLISSVRGPLHTYLATVVKNQDCPALKIGGTTDHVFVERELQAACGQDWIARAGLWPRAD